MDLWNKIQSELLARPATGDIFQNIDIKEDSQKKEALLLFAASRTKKWNKIIFKRGSLEPKIVASSKLAVRYRGDCQEDNYVRTHQRNLDTALEEDYSTEMNAQQDEMDIRNELKKLASKDFSGWLDDIGYGKHQKDHTTSFQTKILQYLKLKAVLTGYAQWKNENKDWTSRCKKQADLGFFFQQVDQATFDTWISTVADYKIPAISTSYTIRDFLHIVHFYLEQDGLQAFYTDVKNPMTRQQELTILTILMDPAYVKKYQENPATSLQERSTLSSYVLRALVSIGQFDKITETEIARIKGRMINLWQMLETLCPVTQETSGSWLQKTTKPRLRTADIYLQAWVPFLQQHNGSHWIEIGLSSKICYHLWFPELWCCLLVSCQDGSLLKLGANPAVAKGLRYGWQQIQQTIQEYTELYVDIAARRSAEQKNWKGMQIQNPSLAQKWLQWQQEAQVVQPLVAYTHTLQERKSDDPIDFTRAWQAILVTTNSQLATIFETDQKTLGKEVILLTLPTGTWYRKAPRKEPAQQDKLYLKWAYWYDKYVRAVDHEQQTTAQANCLPLWNILRDGVTNKVILFETLQEDQEENQYCDGSDFREPLVVLHVKRQNTEYNKPISYPDDFKVHQNDLQYKLYEIEHYYTDWKSKVTAYNTAISIKNNKIQIERTMQEKQAADTLLKEKLHILRQFTKQLWTTFVADTVKRWELSLQKEIVSLSMPNKFSTMPRLSDNMTETEAAKLIQHQIANSFMIILRRAIENTTLETNYHTTSAIMAYLCNENLHFSEYNIFQMPQKDFRHTLTTKEFEDLWHLADMNIEQVWNHFHKDQYRAEQEENYYALRARPSVTPDQLSEITGEPLYWLTWGDLQLEEEKGVTSPTIAALPAVVPAPVPDLVADPVSAAAPSSAVASATNQTAAPVEASAANIESRDNDNMIQMADTVVLGDDDFRVLYTIHENKFKRNDYTVKHFQIYASGKPSNTYYINPKLFVNYTYSYFMTLQACFFFINVYRNLSEVKESVKEQWNISYKDSNKDDMILHNTTPMYSDNTNHILIFEFTLKNTLNTEYSNKTYHGSLRIDTGIAYLFNNTIMFLEKDAYENTLAQTQAQAQASTTSSVDASADKSADATQQNIVLSDADVKLLNTISKRKYNKSIKKPTYRVYYNNNKETNICYVDAGIFITGTTNETQYLYAQNTKFEIMKSCCEQNWMDISEHIQNTWKADHKEINYMYRNSKPYKYNTNNNNNNVVFKLDLQQVENEAFRKEYYGFLITNDEKRAYLFNSAILFLNYNEANEARKNQVQNVDGTTKEKHKNIQTVGQVQAQVGDDQKGIEVKTQTATIQADAWINDLLRLIGQKYNKTYNDFQYNPDDKNVITVGKYKYYVDTTHQLLTNETFNNMFCMYLYDKNIFYTLHATTDIKKNRRDTYLDFELSDALPAYIRTARLWTTLNQILILTKQNETSKKHYYFYVEKNENNTNYYLIFDKQKQLPTWRPQAEQIANQFKSHFG